MDGVPGKNLVIKLNNYAWVTHIAAQINLKFAPCQCLWCVCNTLKHPSELMTPIWYSNVTFGHSQTPKESHYYTIGEGWSISGPIDATIKPSPKKEKKLVGSKVESQQSERCLNSKELLCAQEATWPHCLPPPSVSMVPIAPIHSDLVLTKLTLDKLLCVLLTPFQRLIALLSEWESITDGLNYMIANAKGAISRLFVTEQVLSKRSQVK